MSTKLLFTQSNTTVFNLLPNPSFEVNTTGWSTYTSGAGTSNIYRFPAAGLYPTGRPVALSFDGSTGYVTVPNNAANNISSDITISAWINLYAYAANTSTITAKTTGNGATNNTYEFRINASGNLQFLGFDTALRTIASTTVINPFTPTHVVVTKTGGTATLYINGVASGSGSMGTTNTNTNAMKIGSRDDLVPFFNGIIDDVRMFTRALSATEVTELYTYHAHQQNSNTITFGFTEGSGTTTTDSASSLVGTLTGGCTWAATGLVPAASALQVVANANGSGYAAGVLLAATGLAVGLPYTFSYYVRSMLGSGPSTNGMNTYTAYGQAFYTGTASWQRQTLTFTPGASSANIIIRTNDLNQLFYIDGVQLEVGSAANSYYDVSGGATFDLSDGQATLTSSVQGVEQSPALLVNALKVARSDGEKPVSSQYDKRPIDVTGILIGSSISDYRTRLDNLTMIVNTSGTLDVLMDGWTVTRRFFVYVTNLILTNRPFGLTSGPYTINFVAYDPPFGEDINTTATLYTGTALSASTSQTFMISGTAAGNVAVQISIPVASNLSTVELINSATGDYMQILRNWKTTDVFNFNSATKSVSVNAQLIDYTGNILKFPPGSNTLQINFLPSGIDQSTTAYNTELAIAPATIGLGEGFSASSSYNLGRFDVLLYKVGNPGDLTWQIWGGSGPYNTLITSGTLPAANVGFTPTWIPITFTPVAVTNVNPYMFVLFSATTETIDNAIYWKAANNLGIGGANTFISAGIFTNLGLIRMNFKLWKATTTTSLSANVNVTYKQRWL